MNTEAETGVTHLQAKEGRGLRATTKSEKGKDRLCPGASIGNQPC